MHVGLHYYILFIATRVNWNYVTHLFTNYKLDEIAIHTFSYIINLLDEEFHVYLKVTSSCIWQASRVTLLNKIMWQASRLQLYIYIIKNMSKSKLHNTPFHTLERSTHMGSNHDLWKLRSHHVLLVSMITDLGDFTFIGFISWMVNHSVFVFVFPILPNWLLWLINKVIGRSLSLLNIVPKWLRINVESMRVNNLHTKIMKE